MRVSIGRIFYPGTVDQGGLTQTLATCRHLYLSMRVCLAASSLSRNRWIRVVLPTPLLPSEHNIWKILGYEGGHWLPLPFQKLVDKIGLTHTLATCRTL
jgi:hypothetical protein